MPNKMNQQSGLISHQSTGAPDARRGFLGRFFTHENGHEKTTMEKLIEEHTLARRAIQLDADLARCRRQAAHFLEITAFEDKAIAAITKQQKLDDLCEQINELFADDPMTGLVLTARIKEIYRGSKHGVGRKRKR
jgi:hypothetical protein